QSPSKKKRLPKEEKRDIYDYPEEEEEEEEEEDVLMEVDPMPPKLKLKTHKIIPAVVSKPAPEIDVAPKSFRAVTRVNTSALPADIENSRILSKAFYSVASKSSEDVSLYDPQRVASKNLLSITNGTGDATMRSTRARQNPLINKDSPAIGLIETGKPPPKLRRSRQNASSASDPEADRTGIPSKMLKSPPRPKPAFEPTDIGSSSKRAKSQRRIQTMVVEMSNGANMSVDDSQLDTSDSSSPGSSSTTGSLDPGRPRMPVFHKSFLDTSVPSPEFLLSQSGHVLSTFHKSTLDDIASSSGKAVTESSVWYMLDNASSSSGAEGPRSARKTATLPRRPNLVARMNQAAATAEKAEKPPRNFFTTETHSGASPLPASSSSHALPLSSLPEDATTAPDSSVKTKPLIRTFGRSVSSFDVTEKISLAPPVSVRRWNSEQDPHAMALEGDASHPLPPLPTSPGRQRYVPQNHGGVTVTYGRSRSFLGQGNGGGGEIGGGWFSADDELRDEGLSDSEEEAVDVAKKKDLKSVHELREAGEYKRFSDEMEYILDGLQSGQGLNVKRASCIDLARKLLDTNFTMKLRAHDFIPKIYLGMRAEDDAIIRCCLAFMIVVLVQDKRNVELLMMEDDFLDVVVVLLNDEAADPLKEGDAERVVKKKADKFLVEDVKEIVSSSTLFDEDDEITIKRMGILSLAAILSKHTRYEDFAKDKLRTAGGLQLIVENLFETTEFVPARLAAYEGGQALIPSSTRIDFSLLKNCLLILEASSIQHVANTIAVAAIDKLFPRLLEFLLFCQGSLCAPFKFLVEAYNESSSHAESAMLCLEATIRVLVNLTHENPDGYRQVGRPDGMATLLRVANAGYRWSQKIKDGGRSSRRRGKAEEEKENGEENQGENTVKYDALLLMVGLLINLMENDEENRDEFRRAEQSLTCRGSRKCLRRCRCTDRQSAVCWLADIYHQQDVEDEEKPPTEGNIITAYMAMLLGFLVKDNQENERLLLKRLPNASVASLITILERFVQLSRIVEEEQREREAGPAIAALGGGGQSGIDAMLMMLDGNPDADKAEMMEDVLMGGAVTVAAAAVVAEKSPVDSLSELVEVLKEIEKKNREVTKVAESVRAPRSA
ncbi:wings apart-like protein regulation of heterochromatin-domain-containing protein, partial [Endogone sp. FLAS-F59071]